MFQQVLHSRVLVITVSLFLTLEFTHKEFSGRFKCHIIPVAYPEVNLGTPRARSASVGKLTGGVSAPQWVQGRALLVDRGQSPPKILTIYWLK